ncbi:MULTISPECIES: hypothetical protein [Vibrio]|uniref:MSHA biogenesis protein MshF n=1 Tax=Vibrio ezurae NBRC 102218 TaxID=1219080 RepID=U3AFK9_9VIBR|nr:MULTISPECIES: hypothetical protein [Vibrio]GAD78706.1 hypothetical protein VEZ01S_05_00950 [Vibrio ezurae NBRC 102218]
METSYRNSNLVQLAAWGSVVLILIAVLLTAMHRIRTEAESTLVSLIASKALLRANHLRQHWEMHGKPMQAKINDKTVSFNDKGWVKPILDEVQSCEAWQTIILPKSKQEYSPISVELFQAGNVYSCAYTFSNQEVLVIKMVGGSLSIQKEH